MKNETLINGAGALIVIAGAIMKILHMPYANMVITFGLLGAYLFQSWHVGQLKKRIKELEQK